ncbi:chemotaxis protein [Stylonychia lemnae]|uniref:Chemotaxis protein n=1 Tax=Stylonychia lemnae TaxID=5949 RepID=A0A077ZVS1_STYLE|nr:chemotaxis protein [Stylonychia lemnae]|eukprot:CDW74040.1 chemotaxis protein [Stylonychia lemnae]
MVDTTNSAKKAKKIMIVDDDPFCTQLVKMMLESLGQQVDSATNGKEGVGMYQKNCKGYKLILMDFHMPEVDGFEATKQIRTLEKYLGMQVPVIGLTGDDVKQNPDIESKAMEVGMNQVMTKPVNIQFLQQIVSEFDY